MDNLREAKLQDVKAMVKSFNRRYYAYRGLKFTFYALNSILPAVNSVLFGKTLDGSIQFSDSVMGIVFSIVNLALGLLERKLKPEAQEKRYEALLALAEHLKYDLISPDVAPTDVDLDPLYGKKAK